MWLPTSSISSWLPTRWSTSAAYLFVSVVMYSKYSKILMHSPNLVTNLQRSILIDALLKLPLYFDGMIQAWSTSRRICWNVCHLPAISGSNYNVQCLRSETSVVIYTQFLYPRNIVDHWCFHGDSRISLKLLNHLLFCLRFCKYIAVLRGIATWTLHSDFNCRKNKQLHIRIRTINNHENGERDCEQNWSKQFSRHAKRDYKIGKKFIGGKLW